MTNPDAPPAVIPTPTDIAEENLLKPLDLINLKREHVKRLANQNGAAGELEVLAANIHFLPRPKGVGLVTLLAALREAGIVIKKAGFDAIALPAGCNVDFNDMDSVKTYLAEMTFIEIKTANQARVKSDFSGFFFAFTEGELMASEALGSRHRVMLLNKVTGAMLLTSVPELLARARSTNWQVSVQL